MTQRVSDPLKHASSAAPAPVVVRYRPADATPDSSDSVLACIAFGGSAQHSWGGLQIDVALDPLGAGAVELWQAQGPVTLGTDGSVRYAYDGHHVFAVVDVDEREHGGVPATAEFV